MGNVNFSILSDSSYLIIEFISALNLCFDNNYLNNSWQLIFDLVFDTVEETFIRKIKSLSYKFKHSM